MIQGGHIRIGVVPHTKKDIGVVPHTKKIRERINHASENCQGLPSELRKTRVRYQ